MLPMSESKTTNAGPPLRCGRNTKMRTKAANQLVASLPFFPGFYESSLDYLIDREIEQEMEGDGKPGDEYYRAPKTWEEVDAVANYPAAMGAIARGWVQSFAMETCLAMKWESMQSPREYNFTTDRVFVTLPAETLAKLATVRESEEFAETLEAMFTSYDGFMSFYSNDAEAAEWQKPMTELDHNQLQALIRAYVTKEVDADPRHFRECVEDRPCVYEAAQEVWSSPLKVASA